LLSLSLRVASEQVAFRSGELLLLQAALRSALLRLEARPRRLLASFRLALLRQVRSLLPRPLLVALLLALLLCL
jgi:hypothetical protein